jgi:hypothetical protein
MLRDSKCHFLILYRGWDKYRTNINEWINIFKIKQVIDFIFRVMEAGCCLESGMAQN